MKFDMHCHTKEGSIDGKISIADYIRILKDILGHCNLGTTEIYTHLSNKQMEKAADSNPLSKISKK